MPISRSIHVAASETPKEDLLLAVEYRDLGCRTMEKLGLDIKGGIVVMEAGNHARK